VTASDETKAIITGAIVWIDDSVSKTQYAMDAIDNAIRDLATVQSDVVPEFMTRLGVLQRSFETDLHELMGVGIRVASYRDRL
jgi:hypothetical protein